MTSAVASLRLCSRQVEGRDLEQADLIIAVDAAAHRPVVRSGFPAWEDRIR